MESNRMKELIESILNILPQNTKEIKDDVKDNLKILLNDYLKKNWCCYKRRIWCAKRGSIEDAKKIRWFRRKIK